MTHAPTRHCDHCGLDCYLTRGLPRWLCSNPNCIGSDEADMTTTTTTTTTTTELLEAASALVAGLHDDVERLRAAIATHQEGVLLDQAPPLLSTPDDTGGWRWLSTPDDEPYPLVLANGHRLTNMERLLAERFSTEMRESLTPEQFRIVNAENKDKGNWCSSHQFIDANQVMVYAWDYVFVRGYGIEYESASQVHADITNNAWECAIINGFSLEWRHNIDKYDHRSPTSEVTT